jgi:CRISPR associated protein Cas2
MPSRYWIAPAISTGKPVARSMAIDCRTQHLQVTVSEIQRIAVDVLHPLLGASFRQQTRQSAPAGSNCTGLAVGMLETVTREGRRRLRRVARVCEDYGQRVQYSVFECRLDDTLFETFVAADAGD